MITYDEVVRDFDHSPLAGLPAYARLRQALNDLAGQAGAHDVELAVLLDAGRDITATTPYADDCERCDTWQWPHAVKRDGGWLTCSYRCPCGHAWTCGYAANITVMT
jgi:hypothetical protein